MFNIGSSNVGDFINYCLVIPIGKDVHDYFTISLVSLVEFKVNSKLITKVMASLDNYVSNTLPGVF